MTQSCSITIDPSVQTADVNRLVLGHNVEWADFIHPALWDGEAWNTRALDDMAALRPSTLRFPGGCYGDHYHWRDGVGQWSQRPAMTNPFTRQPTPSWLGTDEYLQLCRHTGAQPWLQTNPVGEPVESMADWAAYCRRAGSPVAWWEIGNEIYLTSPDSGGANSAAIHMSSDDYVSRARDEVSAIRRVEPDARFGAIGGRWTYRGPTVKQADWNERVLPRLGAEVDFVCTHSVYGPIIAIPEWWEKRTERELRDAYLSAASIPQFARANIAVNLAMIDDLTGRRDIGLAVTEWLPLFGLAGAEPLLSSNAMAAALYTAGMLHVFLTEPRLVAAHWLTLAKQVMGACLTLTPDSYNLSVHHAVFSMYAGNLGDHLVRTDIVSDTFDSPAPAIIPEQHGVPVVDAIASRTGAFLSVFCVNRDLDTPRKVRFTVPGARPKHTEHITGHWLDTNGPVAGPYLRARETTDPLRAQSGPTVTGEGPFDAVLPACSVTLLRFELEERQR